MSDKRIEKSAEDKCPYCGSLLELGVKDGEYVDMERCPKCEWQMNFVPTHKRVPFGSDW